MIAITSPRGVDNPAVESACRRAGREDQQQIVGPATQYQDHLPERHRSFRESSLKTSQLLGELARRRCSRRAIRRRTDLTQVPRVFP